MKPSRGPRCICRLEGDRVVGWQARIYEGPYTRTGGRGGKRRGRYRSKLFSDHRHGGKAKARAKAEQWLRRGGTP